MHPFTTVDEVSHLFNLDNWIWPLANPLFFILYLKSTFHTVGRITSQSFHTSLPLLDRALEEDGISSPCNPNAC